MQDEAGYAEAEAFDPDAFDPALIERYEAVVAIFVDADEARVHEICAELTALFGPQLTGLHWEPYYKFAGCHTIWFYLPTTHHEQPDTNTFLLGITNQLATGWSLSLGQDAQDISGHAIWNPGPESRFCFPETRFAHIDFCHPDYNAKFLAEFVPAPLD